MLFLTLAASLAPTPALAAPLPQATDGTKLEKKNVVLMSPGVVYHVQMAGKPVEVTLLRERSAPASEWESATIRSQLSIDGAVVRSDVFYEGEEVGRGDVFLVKVTTSDTLVYQHDLVKEGGVFVSSVVFRFDGRKLVDATKRDSSGYGAGWFKLDRNYDSKAGAGKVVTTVKGITNTCQYVKNKVSCAAKLPRPKAVGTFKVGKTVRLQLPAQLTLTTRKEMLWYRCNAKGRACNGIALNVKKGIPANKKTYKLTKADKGKRLMVCASYGYDHWNEWTCSKPSAKIK